jgi:hypothetical protein
MTKRSFQNLAGSKVPAAAAWTRLGPAIPKYSGPSFCGPEGTETVGPLVRIIMLRHGLVPRVSYRFMMKNGAVRGKSPSMPISAKLWLETTASRKLLA